MTMIPPAQIDEPKTPYTEYEYHSDADGDSVASGGGMLPRSPDNPTRPKTSCITTHWDDISSRLQAVADRRDMRDRLDPLSSPTPSWNASDGEDEGRRRTFEDARRRHYNEAEEIRRWKAEHADDDDDEDDDDEE
jgi:protein phosphatase inhibitor 2